MKDLSIHTLAQLIGSEPPAGCQTMVTGISTDSRTIKAGECFFALAGENFDGHDYVAEVLRRGAACAVVSRDVNGGAGPLLKVPDTVRALGDLARAYRRMNPFRVVAITGSVGKTTTRQIVHHVLRRHFRTHQAQKSFNNHIGLPLTLLGAGPADEVIIAELGANHPGEIAHLTRIAQPDIAIVTNAHPAHLEGFGGLDTIIREKLSISEGLAEGGVLIINGDLEPLVRGARHLAMKEQGQDALATKGRPFRTFGKSAGVDYRAEQIACSGTHSTFTIRDVQVRLPLPGPGNVENALAAWAICDQFGLSVNDFAKAVAGLSAVSMRAETLQIGKLTILNDCYNANPASMRNALSMLRNLRCCCDCNHGRRLVFICGPMAELGPQTESLHAELGAAVAEAGVDLLVAIGDGPKTTAKVAREMSPHEVQTLCFADTGAVCDHVQEFVRADDIILVKGSRTARLERVVERLMKDDG
jgi:UDP-N-acetylmuramoyl-tripeptide--D-alanyl-D-alanine ligase